jgi:hypothetical protein
MSNPLELVVRLAGSVAPELTAHRPLYVVSRAACESIGLMPDDCCGLALPEIVAPQVVDLLRAAGKWTGPGPVVVLDLAAIEEDAPRGHVEHATFAVACHEYAHLLPARPVLVTSDTPELRAAHVELIEQFRAAPIPPIEADPSHDLAFIRRYCHLIVRATDACWPIHVRGGWGSFPLGMCAESYLAAVADEARLMRDWSFARIEATPPPQALVDRWEADLAFRARFRERAHA